MAGHVLEDERGAVRVGRLADVGGDLELGAHRLRDVHELPGFLEGVEVLAEVRHGRLVQMRAPAAERVFLHQGRPPYRASRRAWRRSHTRTRNRVMTLAPMTCAVSMRR